MSAYYDHSYVLFENGLTFSLSRNDLRCTRCSGS